jgi:hypothetical protein
MRSCLCTYGMKAVVIVAVLGAAAPASAQLTPRSLSNPATGESYHIEAMGSFWNPAPNFLVRSEALRIVGSQIDGVEDLGITQKRVGELRLVARPAKKHKFRFDRIPVKYESTSILTRTIVFNGQSYQIGLPVTTDFQWTTMKFGYEYDFVYRDRGFAGIVLDVRATDIQVELSSLLVGTEFARARAPIPAIGGIGRVYVVPNVSVTFELDGIKIPQSIVGDDYDFRYVDFDLYGTVNFNNYVGAQFGYRSLDVLYKVKSDDGTLKLKGFYFGGVVRY